MSQYNEVLAIFVKTPELSPVKTRLASSIGQAQALKFYEMSLLATAAVARAAQDKIPTLDVVWAVAEPQALSAPRWSAFKTVSQGEGGLGERLSHVYDQLKSKYEYISFIGADSPHILPTQLVHALNLTKQKASPSQFVIGETDDGGFYYFGSSQNLKRSVWLGIEYSSEKTAAQLIERVQEMGPVKKIQTAFDIDTFEDLSRLAHQSVDLPEQQTVVDWARSLKN